MKVEINKKTFLVLAILSCRFVFSKYVSIIDSKGVAYRTTEVEGIHVVERNQTSDGGYVIWSDGYKEAYGQHHKGGNLTNGEVITINLPFTLSQPNNAYANANIIGRNGDGEATINIDSLSTNSVGFAPDCSHSGTLVAHSFTWTIKGY